MKASRRAITWFRGCRQLIRKRVFGLLCLALPFFLYPYIVPSALDVIGLALLSVQLFSDMIFL
jgi:hypothetical protein